MNNNAKQEDPFAKYIGIIIFDIILALILGVITNKFINYISIIMNFNFYIKVLLQILFVALIIYFMKEISVYLHHEPQDNYSYDVIFISVYIGSQQNFQELLTKFK